MFARASMSVPPEAFETGDPLLDDDDPQHRFVAPENPAALAGVLSPACCTNWSYG
jgi:hypothetical protein